MIMHPLIHLQLLTIHLEELDCFAAWVSARDLVGSEWPPDTPETKGMLLLLLGQDWRKLFSYLFYVNEG